MVASDITNLNSENFNNEHTNFSGICIIDMDQLKREELKMKLEEKNKRDRIRKSNIRNHKEERRKKRTEINNKEKEWLIENGYENIEEYYKEKDSRLIKHEIPDYKRGELDPNSSVGFAFISQRVVAKVLGLNISNDCNCEFGFNFKYDLYDENKHGSINVKTASCYKNSSWSFGLLNNYIPDTYILTGFSIYKEDILHVWIIPSFILIGENHVYISKKSLEQFKIYEVDSEPYNSVYHNMSIERCKVLKSVNN